jgi:hypothetical protein
VGRALLCIAAPCSYVYRVSAVMLRGVIMFCLRGEALDQPGPHLMIEITVLSRLWRFAFSVLFVLRLFSCILVVTNSVLNCYVLEIPKEFRFIARV